MNRQIFLWLLFSAALAQAAAAGTMVIESEPDLPIPDNSCLDPITGSGQGGVSDLIGIGVLLSPELSLRVEVEIDHLWRSDLQVALVPGSLNASQAIGLVSLNGVASATPVLANGHDSNADNYYATFDDRTSVDCSTAAACGGATNCTGLATSVSCRPDQPIFDIFSPPVNPGAGLRLRICDRESGITGILRRWRVYISGFIPVELQSFSVD